jgi:hypothetical protein
MVIRSHRLAIPAYLAAAVAVTLCGCGTAPPTATPVGHLVAPAAATAATPALGGRADAIATAQRLLHRRLLPAGAHRVSRLPRGVLSQPATEPAAGSYLVTRTALFTVPGSAETLIDRLAHHVPAGLSSNGTGTLTGPGSTVWEAGLTLDTTDRLLAQAGLVVSAEQVASHADIRVDAQVVYRLPFPTGSRRPVPRLMVTASCPNLAARVPTGTNPATAGLDHLFVPADPNAALLCAYSNGRLLASRRLAAPAATRLARTLDGPAYPLGPDPDAVSCPAGFAGAVDIAFGYRGALSVDVTDADSGCQEFTNGVGWLTQNQNGFSGAQSLLDHDLGRSPDSLAGNGMSPVGS